VGSHGDPHRLHLFCQRRVRCNRNRPWCELTKRGAVPEAETRLKSLMLLSLDGDAGAYRELLQVLSTRLRAYYRRRLGSNASDAEDLVQETLIAIHARRSSYDRSQPFTAWAYAMARYKLVDHLRRSRVRAAISVDDCEELFATDETEQAVASRDVERVLSGLPKSVSEAIRLTRIEGLSVEEAAGRMGKTATATKVSIHRGLMRLSSKLAGRNDADD
jgi:RNA polymerase sigma factor (sigma-70 family)